ncbi:MAG: hypothetical protein M3333_01705 [Actinomycetota bacterium]|nr:hypothetical protein [Actinomycetota bacterium]
MRGVIEGAPARGGVANGEHVNLTAGPDALDGVVDVWDFTPHSGFDPSCPRSN